MMNGTMVTLVGVAVSQVRYATTVGGVPVAHFRLAATERRFDRPRQVWVEGDTSYFTVWAWRSLAENALTSIGCGDPLLVTGRMRIREWERPDGQPKGVSAEIEATALGHDLARGTTVFRRTLRGRPELVASASERNRIAEQRRTSIRGERPPAAEREQRGEGEPRAERGSESIQSRDPSATLATAAVPEGKVLVLASACQAAPAREPAPAEATAGRGAAAASTPPGPA
ncbi:single-stranded DNA-binding protein [Streptacidiphilus melanogenes]|uniref:single-stranded DNA-binding protein n=1 Tax=Streptacidiphilus melanogenes TaxID=411235 RepID=UPI0007C6D6D6|nr:single-stranded DNA-binding protein [Streptacidiphilus melanogenes]